MKNMWLLPTDKPSRVYEINSIGKLDWSEGYLQQVDGATNQNIYITSDEEIKDGDWFISLYSNSIQRELTLDWTLNKDVYKKIILTTDVDLIKDGTQKIDDDFLEWFIKNQSCEFVEVDKEYIDLSDLGYYSQYYIYKILVPKLEPKQDMLEMGQIIPKPKVIIVGNPDVKKIMNDTLLDAALELIERSLQEINHLKHEYKDVGHGGKYIHDAESFIKKYKK